MYTSFYTRTGRTFSGRTKRTEKRHVKELTGQLVNTVPLKVLQRTKAKPVNFMISRTAEDKVVRSRHCYDIPETMLEINMADKGMDELSPWSARQRQVMKDSLLDV